MKGIITRFTVTENICLISLGQLDGGIGSAANVLHAFREQNMNIDMITKAYPTKGSNYDMSFTIDANQLPQAMQVIGGLKKSMGKLSAQIGTGNTKLCVYGSAMADTPGIASALLDALTACEADVRLITTSEVDISVLVAEIDTDSCAAAIREVFGVE